jgi:hypothetical protein
MTAPPHAMVAWRTAGSHRPPWMRCFPPVIEVEIWGGAPDQLAVRVAGLGEYIGAPPSIKSHSRLSSSDSVIIGLLIPHHRLLARASIRRPTLVLVN